MQKLDQTSISLFLLYITNVSREILQLEWEITPYTIKENIFISFLVILNNLFRLLRNMSNVRTHISDSILVIHSFCIPNFHSRLRIYI